MTIESQDHDNRRVVYDGMGYDIDDVGYEFYDDFVMKHVFTRPEPTPATDNADPFALPVEAVPSVTRADVDRLEREWWAAQTAPRTFDEAISEPFYSNSVNAHTAYLVAWSIYMNQPWAMPCAEDRAKLEQARLDAAMAIEAPAKPKPAPVTPAAVGRIHGVVTFFNIRSGYGYIKSDANERFFFTAQALKPGTSITLGDMVTFQRTEYSYESQPKATLILVDGTLPAAKQAYTAPQERVLAAQQTVKAQRATRKAHNAAKRENDRKNAQSVANMPKRGAS